MANGTGVKARAAGAGSAVVGDEAWGPDDVPVPGVLRLRDENAVNGWPYSLSPWRELPDFVCWVVERLGIDSAQWDRALSNGMVAELADLDREHEIPAWVRIKRDRQGRVYEEIHVSSLDDPAAWF